MSANFRWKGGRTPTTSGFRKLVPALSRGVVCMILRLAVLIQYRRDTQTHSTDTHAGRQTNDDC